MFKLKVRHAKDIHLVLRSIVVFSGLSERNNIRGGDIIFEYKKTKKRLNQYRDNLHISIRMMTVQFPLAV